MFVVGKRILLFDCQKKIHTPAAPPLPQNKDGLFIPAWKGRGFWPELGKEENSLRCYHNRSFLLRCFSPSFLYRCFLYRCFLCRRSARSFLVIERCEVKLRCIAQWWEVIEGSLSSVKCAVRLFRAIYCATVFWS